MRCNNHKIISYSVLPQDVSNASIIIMLYVRLKSFYRTACYHSSLKPQDIYSNLQEY